jgi:hypothetical protein
VDRLIGVATAPGPTPTTRMFVRSEFDAGGAREHAHAAFGEAIRGIAGHRPIFVDRGDVDDAAASALLQHLPGGNLSAEEGVLRLMFSTLSYCASVVSRIDVRVSTPALFTMTSTRPNFSTVVSISFCSSAT